MHHVYQNHKFYVMTTLKLLILIAFNNYSEAHFPILFANNSTN